MTVSIPTNEPTELRAGLTWQWTRQLTDYSAPTWTLKYAFKNAAARFEITATGSGTTHSVTVARGTTDDYAAGVYQWVAYVESATERFEVDGGTLTVLPDYAQASQVARDDRTHARIVLDALEAVIEGRASKDQQSYQINGRSLERMPVKDLLAFRAQYRAEVESEEINARLESGQIGAPRLLARL